MLLMYGKFRHLAVAELYTTKILFSSCCFSSSPSLFGIFSPLAPGPCSSLQAGLPPTPLRLPRHRHRHKAELQHHHSIHNITRPEDVGTSTIQHFVGPRMAALRSKCQKSRILRRTAQTGGGHCRQPEATRSLSGRRRSRHPLARLPDAAQRVVIPARLDDAHVRLLPCAVSSASRKLGPGRCSGGDFAAAWRTPCDRSGDNHSIDGPSSWSSERS
ncbi:uncharacterized protein LOC112341781 [Selaginella moellendorffii]|uniref:uncharacterized protein LOC112341781 n=1 Tax=Selaginella moellendorffii TaxID=88036 RepID=UPI000D1CF79C|nr:uncharacterized protein LOC112341781 [Selaginella moellendorffii]|eukprot:XP_024518256.1 uncharacterized protein LOC112341781 [Selaginella moellendorffii]